MQQLSGHTVLCALSKFRPWQSECASSHNITRVTSASLCQSAVHQGHAVSRQAAQADVACKPALALLPSSDDALHAKRALRKIGQTFCTLAAFWSRTHVAALDLQGAGRHFARSS